jgi:hypothetical protein
MRRIKGAMLRKSFFLLSLLAAFSALGLGSADLQVTLEGPASVRPGETVHVTATLTNAGPTASENVRWSLQVHDRACYAYENIGTLEAGERRVYECSFDVPVREYPSYQIYIGAGAQSETTPDYAPDNNYHSIYADLITLPDVQSFISHYEPVVPGELFTADVVYVNLARTPTERAILTITVPEKFGKVPEFCTVEGNRARCDVGPVPVDDNREWRRFSIEVYAPDISAHTFEISIESEVAEGDAGPSNDRATARVNTYRTFYATDGPESLASAIHAANASCAQPDAYPCLVTIRGAEHVSWTLREPLPAILGSFTTIDGLGRIELLGHELEEGLGIVMPFGCYASIRGFQLRGFRTAAIAVGTGSGTFCSREPWRPTRFVENNELTDNGVGVHVDGSIWNVRGNTIARSARSGVRVESGINRVLNNVIRDNGASGVFIAQRAGGTDVDDNEIMGNGHAGVAIAGDALHVAVNGNSMYANRGLAIDWGIDGATPQGPVPAPVITNAYYEDGVTIIEGELPHSGYLYAPRLQFYVGDVPGDARFIGKTEINNEDHFRFTVAGDLRGKWVSATRMRIEYYGWLRGPRADADTGYSYTTTSELGNTVQVR